MCPKVIRVTLMPVLRKPGSGRDESAQEPRSRQSTRQAASQRLQRYVHTATRAATASCWRTTRVPTGAHERL